MQKFNDLASVTLYILLHENIAIIHGCHRTEVMNYSFEDNESNESH